MASTPGQNLFPRTLEMRPPSRQPCAPAAAAYQGAAAPRGASRDHSHKR
jgi:hypothetical protein